MADLVGADHFDYRAGKVGFACGGTGRKDQGSI